MEEIVKEFLNKTIPDMNSREYDLSYIKFVFDEDALAEMLKIADSKKANDSVNYLKQIHDNYRISKENEEDIFIEITDYKKFFSLLESLVTTYSEREYKNLLNSVNFIRSIWLRMSPSDIDNVNEFLEKQLAFLKFDNLLPYNKTLYKKHNDLDIVYKNKSNDDWFETNNHVTFSFVKEKLEDSLFSKNDEYNLPSIHYAFNKENNEPVCYIYGMQNLSNKKDEKIKEEIKPLRKNLQNKYISPDFILSLKIFIDFLRDNNIENIKVPLLQVFNYPYHKHLSKSVNEAYLAYEDEKDSLDEKYKSGEIDEKVLDYIHDKNMHAKFVGKEDIISKNKTERLVNAFFVMQEKYDNIEFLNDPFIESDYLVIKVKKELKKTK